MLVVVSGHSRGVGKTSLIRAIRGAFPSYRFSTLKLSAHAHTTLAHPRATPGEDAAWLLGASDEKFEQALPVIDRLVAARPHWIVESNRLALHRRPDLLLFVYCPEIADWKATADHCLANADAVALRDITAAARLRARAFPSCAHILLQPEPGLLNAQSIAWLGERFRELDGRPRIASV